MDNSIVLASDAIRTAWLTPQPPSTVARLPWTGAKRDTVANFFRPLWLIIKAHRGPVCLTNTTNRDLDYAGWFNYFFNEAKQIGKENEEFQVNIGRIASLLFDLPTVGAGNAAKIAMTLPAALCNGFTTMLASTPSGVPRKILDYLFELGFEEAQTTTAGDYFSRGIAFKSNMTDTASVRSSKGEFVIAYRGDTRDLGQIIRQGAKCRAELDSWRADAGVNQDWHPWSGLTENWKKMWFRIGAKDNDYFTLNSLAKHFHISCAYPMFRSFEIDQRLVGPVSGWGQQLRALLVPKKIEIVTVYDRKTSSWQEVPTDESRVFACAISTGTTAAKTYELNDYPESAVRNVNIEDMVAWIKVRRYHRPPDDPSQPYDSTHVDPAMTIRVMTWGWVRSEDETRASLGVTKDGIKLLGSTLQNMMGKVFDISHTTYYSAASYDVHRRQTASVSSVKPVTPKSVRLTNR